MLLCGLGLPLAGCLNFGKVDDAKVPGDLLGVYAVQGELTASTCGDGALGAEPTWSFDVKLSRFDNDLYWLNGREAVVGDIASDGRSFTITSSVQVDVSAPGRGKPGCSVLRHDHAKGRLSAAGSDVKSFEGSLSFEYEAVAGSDCSDWIGTPGAVTTLPCELSYDLDASRSADK